MQDIYVYTPEFTLLHIENRLTSVQWTECFADVGKLELHTDTKSDLVPILMKNRDAIFMQGEASAILTGMTDVRGGFDFAAYGRSLSQMLAWRVVQPFSMTDTAENIIRKKVQEAFMQTGPRLVSGFVLAPSIGGTASTAYEVKDSPKLLLDVVKELCETEDLGFSVDFRPESKQFVFSLLRGTDRSAGQSAVTPLFFSEDEHNFSDAQYTFNGELYRSCGYRKVTSADGETTSYVAVDKDDTTGYYRRESILNGETAAEAGAELQKAAKTEEIEGTTHNVTFGTNYGLGDIVTVQKMVGNTLVAKDKRIKEVWRVFERLNSYERPTMEEV